MKKKIRHFACYEEIKKEDRKFSILFLYLLFTSLILCNSFIFLLENTHAQQQTETNQNSKLSVNTSNCQSETNQEYKYIISASIKNFIEKINEQGRCGYKLEKLTKYPLNAYENYDEMIVAGIIKLDLKSRYEYDWFESFTPGEVVTKINLAAKNGFYYRDILPVAQGLCDNNSNSSSEKSETERIFDRFGDSLSFSLGNIYFLERKDGIEKKNEYRVIIGVPGWGKKPTEELQKSLDDSLSNGFNPVAMGSYKILNKYAVALLVEKVQGNQNRNDALQYQIIRTESGFEKKINNLAKKGFKLIFSGEMMAYRHALMLKDGQNPTAFSYQWVDVNSKSYLNKIQNLAQSGSNFRFTASKTFRCDLSESELVFETNLSEKQSKFEFKTLNLSNDDLSEVSDNQTTDDVLAISVEKTKKIKDLLNEGYLIKDIFYTDEVNVLFARQK